MKIITEAIQSKNLLQFSYHGNVRLVEPHLLGVHDGVTQLLSYQVGGYSRSGRIPEWRRFDVHEMTGLQVLTETFAGPRERNIFRNSDWDRVIAVVR